MDSKTPLPPPSTLRRNPPRRAKQTPAITSFSLDGDPKPESEPKPKPKQPSDSSEKLRVYLRVRPLEVEPKPKPTRAPKGKAPSSAKGTKIKNNTCLVVSDSSSVTLSAPPSAFDSKRAKSEVYDGFSFVFPQQSLQEEIYERVMDPLVMDFIGGKSGLLAAMGPTGSGKTYTLFGSPREPGIVPLALRRIFSHTLQNSNPQTLRSYYLSMFEIYSERGKGERIFDLSPDGIDLSLQQSSVKGLQEISISNAIEAEILVASGMLKRATAATNANHQSSRSQCIITIRSAVEIGNDEIDNCSTGAVLTIADLAGSERERKTGNQGARLLESNFINNTSMVFGLCLRSLLEHQKNPKKSFEKHFKNSLLTRYLRDYLEGKKRMTLILTVKSGEDDYLDTSFLLRQASPYMKIKFSNLDDFPDVRAQKRSTSAFIRIEHHKRRKCIDFEASKVDHGKNEKDVLAGCQRSERGVNSEKPQENVRREISNISLQSLDTSPMDADINELQLQLARMKRNDEIMKGFSKALWTVLKQYKNKLEISENEVRTLKGAVIKEINQAMELKTELKELRCLCTCQIKPSFVDLSRSEVDAPFSHRTRGTTLSSLSPDNSKNIGAKFSSSHISELLCQIPEISSASLNDHESPGLKGILFDTNLAGSCKSVSTSLLERSSLVLERPKLGTHDAVDLSNLEDSERQHNEIIRQECRSLLGNEGCSDDLVQLDSNFGATNGEYLDLADASVRSCTVVGDEPTILPASSQQFEGKVEIFKEYKQNSEDLDGIKDSQMELSSTVDVAETQSQLLVQPSLFAGREKDDKGNLPSSNQEAHIEKQQLHVCVSEKNKSDAKKHLKNGKHESPSEPQNLAKPRRRLLPASTILLKEFSVVDVEEDNGKENRGKVTGEVKGRSQGSLSLIRLLKSNLHL